MAIDKRLPVVPPHAHSCADASSNYNGRREGQRNEHPTRARVRVRSAAFRCDADDCPDRLNIFGHLPRVANESRSALESTAYHLTSEGLDLVTEDQLVSTWKSGDDPCWLDAIDAPDTWVKNVLSKIGANPLIEHAVFKRPSLATSLVVGHSVYFRVPVLLQNQDAPVYLHALTISKLLITWRSGATKELDEFIDDLKAPTDTPWVTTMPDLVASLCAMLSMDAFQESQRLLQQINAMSDEADKTGEISRGLNTADRRLHALDETAGAYTQVFVMLRDEVAYFHDRPDAQARISNAINNTSAVVRSVRVYYNRLNTLRERESEHTNQKTNRRLGLLSVLSAIFLPLTLLTGIFGMNFEHMPGLSQEWAYPTLLLVMLVLGLGLWRYFVRRGWP